MHLCSSKNQRKDSGNYSLTKSETDKRFIVNKQFKDKKKTFRSKPQPKTSRKATRHINTDLSEQGNRFNNTEVYQQWPVKSSIFLEQNARSKWQKKHFFFVEQKWVKEEKAIVSPDREHTPTNPQQKNKQAKTKMACSTTHMNHKLQITMHVSPSGTIPISTWMVDSSCWSCNVVWFATRL